ncbi:AraC family transcriptional regulator [Wolinella succinogenes]|uniref:helix-turn-helix transcriptional regulator n=1 Tax=Wolinella succinogenes TaxID=844 RepID=UPI002FCB4E34
MGYKINYHDLEEFIKNPQCTATRIEIPGKRGFGEGEKEILENGLGIFKSQIFASEDLTIDYRIPEEIGGWVMWIVDEGESLFARRRGGKECQYQRGKLTLSTSEYIQDGISHSRAGCAKGIMIHLSESFLRRYLGEEVRQRMEKNGQGLLEFIPVPPVTQMLSKAILRSSFEGQSNRLLLQSRALEVVAHQMDRWSSRSVSRIALAPCEIEALHIAKSLLEDQFLSPPSLMELAKEVRINEFKLKSGFKALFGFAPYQWVLELKMQEGKRLLSMGEMSVFEVSKHLGYSKQQSFTVAFARRFGYLPKDLLKASRFYYFNQESAVPENQNNP